MALLEKSRNGYRLSPDIPNNALYRVGRIHFMKPEIRQDSKHVLRDGRLRKSQFCRLPTGKDGTEAGMLLWTKSASTLLSNHPRSSEDTRTHSVVVINPVFDWFEGTIRGLYAGRVNNSVGELPRTSMVQLILSSLSSLSRASRRVASILTGQNTTPS
jgi:hypothetical protein